MKIDLSTIDILSTDYTVSNDIISVQSTHAGANDTVTITGRSSIDYTIAVESAQTIILDDATIHATFTNNLANTAISHQSVYVAVKNNVSFNDVEAKQVVCASCCKRCK